MKKSIVRRLLSLVMALTICSSFLVAPASAKVDVVAEAYSTVEMALKGWDIVSEAEDAAAAVPKLAAAYLGGKAAVVIGALAVALEAVSNWESGWPMTEGYEAYNENRVLMLPYDALYSLCQQVQEAQGTWDKIRIADISVAHYKDGYYGIMLTVHANRGPNTEHLPEGVVVGARQFWLCDKATGDIVLGTRQLDSDGDLENNTPSTSANIVGKWVSDTVAMKSPTYRMVSREDLYNRAVELRGSVSLRKGMYFIIDYMGENIYCGNDGKPYAAWAQNSSATETDRVTDVVIDGTSSEIVVEPGEDVGIDIEELIAKLPTGDTITADQIIYDNSSQTYYVNTTTGNTTEGGDTTYNTTYNYSYTYNIDYTSVTYIGQTAEYTKHYEVYYKLPDGRSSADLTAEELEQLNLAVDVLNYGRSADDVSLRSLYHFDGETTDASYWNYCTDFTWNTGASLTYMDAGNFEGALYLDETAHDFTITLPSNLSNGDFTLQFRYYQSATLAPQTDSYIKFDDYSLLQFNGKQFLDMNGDVLCTTPIGTWNEVALIRHRGTLYYYLNGVKVGSLANILGYGTSVRFIFGSAQQTYKYFDELRFLNIALVESGASYTPSSVPYDTNLSLILPTESKPIADEYWVVNGTKTNLLGFTFEEFLTGKGQTLNAARAQADVAGVNFPRYFNVDGYGTITTGASGFLFGRTSSYSSVIETVSGYKFLTAPINIKLGKRTYSKVGGTYYNISYWNYITGKSYAYSGGSASAVSDGAAKPYVFSLVLADGTISSVPFNFSATSFDSKTVSFDWGKVVFGSYNQYGTGGDYSYYISIVPNSAVEVLYMELCEGTETDLAAEHITSVIEMTPEQLGSFTLAVRSDVEVTSYQIGGVRPSLPKKGMVWALVEGGTITSLQIYNGRAWEEVDGRIWTGSRWASLSSYDVKLQKDLADIVGITTAPEYEYIYTESGFWDWWQKSWNSFTTKFFDTQSPQTPDDKHIHSYVGEVLSEATCTKAGQTKYVCVGCGDSYIEATKPLDHDFEEISDTESGHVEPTGLICSHCASTDISCELSGPVAVCTCNDCLYVWEVQADYEYGETLYKCRRCGEEKKDTKDDRGLFSLIGSFFADTIRWIVSKLGSLVAALAALAQLFADFIETVISFAGDHPAFFAAALALIPADLMTLIWFSIVSGIIMLVWKKFKG